MVAAFRKKNTVEQTFFHFNENFFNYFSNQYLYEDINEIRIARSKFELRVIGVGSDYSYAIAIEIKMNNYEILKITEQPTFFSKEDQSKIKYIEDFIAIALKKSLRNRLKKYTDQVELNKYFSYSDWFFYVEDRVLFDKKNNKKYQINSINIFKHYGALEIKQKNNSFVNELLQNTFGKPIVIDTLTDTDMFFTLLKHYFQISWEK